MPKYSVRSVRSLDMNDPDHVSVTELIEKLQQFSPDAEVYVETVENNYSLQAIEEISVEDTNGEPHLLVALNGV